MKIIFPVLLVFTFAASAQRVHVVKVAPFNPTFDSTYIYQALAAKQALLVSSVNIKTVNSVTLVGAGNINITSIPTPEADFYGSTSDGNNGFVGSSRSTAKKTLRSLDTVLNASTNATLTVALQAGNTYKGTDGIALSRGRVSFTSYDFDKAGKHHFPILLGTDVFNSGWTLTGSNTYQQSITHTITLALENYAYMYVVEIDTALERVAPLTARRYLRYVPSLAAVDTTAGSYFTPVSDPVASPTLLSIHTSDGASPNNHALYRYEVVTRDRAINRNLGGSLGSPLSVEKLFVMDYGQGSGAIASRQDSFYAYRCSFLGNAIHQGVYGNFSTIDRCAYMIGDATIDGNAIVFYQVEGAHETNTISNTYFLGQKAVVYSHISNTGTIPHGKLAFTGNYVFDVSTKVVSSDAVVDTVDMNFNYIQNSGVALHTSGSSVNYIHNSIFNKIEGVAYSVPNLIVDNVLHVMRTAPSHSFTLTAHNTFEVNHSIIHIKTTTTNGSGEGGEIFTNSDTTERIKAKYNIFIAEVSPTSIVRCMTGNTYAGAGTTPDVLDYNAYIIVSGSFVWQLTSGASNGGLPYVTSLSAWQTQSGQDAHSIVIDLRNYEGNLKRIFVDPAAGNYNLTSSPQADSIRTILAGMRTPPGSFLNTPSREKILYIVENDGFVPVSRQFQTVSSSENYTANTTLTAAAVLNFTSTSAQTSADLTVAVPGATLGCEVLMGVPNGSVLSNCSYSAWVSATDVVTVRLNNYSSSAKDPASGTFRFTLIKH